MTLRPTINDMIPAELMGEIFLCCIPPDPLRYRQPNVTIAPMILCHVCSHWRQIALVTPYIWTHLYHVAYLKTPVGTFNHGDITFLRWWRERVKGVPPSLRLAFKQDDVKVDDRQQEMESRLSSSGFVSSMVQFMSNARYLNLDFHYNHLLRTLYGERPLSCPHLDTLVMPAGFNHHAPFVFVNTAPQAIDQGVHVTEKYIPVPHTQYIRRFALEMIFISLDDVSSILDFSNVTHLRLDVDMTPNGWFSLLRESVNLVYGSFNIRFKGNLRRLSVDTRPKPDVLPHLQKMAFNNRSGDHIDNFLEGLHLPSLTALRITKSMPPSVEGLHKILSSTPALRTLQLGTAYISDRALDGVFVPGDLSPIPAPLSSVVPQLETIRFEGAIFMVKILDPANRTLVLSVLTGDWLQLGNPGSSISRVHLGTMWEPERVPFGEVIDLAKELQKSMPPGVELAARPLDVRPLWQNSGFTDEFEDLGFKY